MTRKILIIKIIQVQTVTCMMKDVDLKLPKRKLTNVRIFLKKEGWKKDYNNKKSNNNKG